jgi:hypothetical protein
VTASCAGGTCRHAVSPDGTQAGLSAALRCCGGTLVDTSTNAAHCGGCGMACAARPGSVVTCEMGACAYACAPGFGDCDGDATNGCEVEFATSLAHCGRCNNACAFTNAAASCAFGACALGACNGDLCEREVVLRDGGVLRRRIVHMTPVDRRSDVDAWVGDSVSGLRQYGLGRTVLSAIVAAITAVTAIILGLPLVLTIAVVDFIGGYVPYLGGLIGGGLAVTVAFAEGGIVPAVVMLIVSLLSNLLLENFVEPKVMGDRLDMHPALVLVITSLGGVLGGLVGLMLAVPFALVARAAFTRFLGPAGLGAAASRAQSELRKLTGSA